MNRRFAAGASRWLSANGLTSGAAAVAAQISGVSRRTAYRSAPVMGAREDPAVETRDTGAPFRRTAQRVRENYFFAGPVFVYSSISGTSSDEGANLPFTKRPPFNGVYSSIAN